MLRVMRGVVVVHRQCQIRGVDTPRLRRRNLIILVQPRVPVRFRIQRVVCELLLVGRNMRRLLALDAELLGAESGGVLVLIKVWLLLLKQVLVLKLAMIYAIAIPLLAHCALM